MGTPYPLPPEVDVAIVGAGPVGLALAIELSRLELTTLVVDRRPPPAQDTLRPQMLVARAGDLAHLARLGVDLDVVSMLTARCQTDAVSRRVTCGGVDLADGVPPPAGDLLALAAQPPLALVPIGRLQEALLVEARRRGAQVAYGVEIGKLRRHAREVSLTHAGGTLRAKLAIIATGAARALVTEQAFVHTSQRMIAGVFAAGEASLWTRVEVPVRGFANPARATVLQTPTTGTAVIVGTPVAAASDEQLHGCFATAAVSRGLAGAPFLAPPRPFVTGATAVARRVIAGDGRAPVVIAGDAAQTGHVFTGQTCFINIALALGLCDDLRRARGALRDGKLAAVAHALETYERRSDLGAAILVRASARHQAAVARA